MTRRMLIDGAHPEEVRVVITEGTKLLDYDIESSTKTQNKGNIYLAKVMRVEPSLQAAFVDYGGNRHGFLAFNEIHPDYYQIPFEDREALKRHAADFERAAIAAKEHLEHLDGDGEVVLDVEQENLSRTGAENKPAPDLDGERLLEPEGAELRTASESVLGSAENNSDGIDELGPTVYLAELNTSSHGGTDSIKDKHPEIGIENYHQGSEEETENRLNEAASDGFEKKTDDDSSDLPNERGRETSPPQVRRYKIQEVIKRNQIILIQVVKEERGNKGAALTTYLSLAGRYCVLMPNVTRGNGGVSRKITSVTDRRRLRDVLKSLSIPDGMGVIMRTAGIQRNKSEIKRDFEYLMRLWEDVREKTLVSSAPNLVYEEGDLVKRAIRDLYTREVEEIWVEGTETYQSAKKQMRMMMPSHAKRVQPYKELSMPMFHRYQVENQIEAMHNPVVQLKSGGYLVINPTEALVAIDVNSGRATKERNIEETATKTNLEAASEIAYQLKLRDLAGLIVIDFIDMEERANQRSVERRFKESVKADRAKIQIGRISNFGLLEMSRQRMRPSLVENSTQPCPHCSGTGNVRSTESMTLHALRLIEEEGTRMRSSEVSITLPNHIALYLLNEKRDALDAMESKYSFRIRILGDDSISATEIQLDRVKTRKLVGEKKIENEILSISEENDSQNDPARKKRSRRRRRKKSEPENLSEPASSVTEEEVSVEATPGLSDEGSPEQGPVRKRRGRRGGKRRPPRDKDREAASADAVGSPQQEVHEHLPEKPEAAKDVAAVEEFKADTESRKVQSTKTNKSNDKKQGIEEIEPKTGSNPAPKKGWWQRILD